MEEMITTVIERLMDQRGSLLESIEPLTNNQNNQNSYYDSSTIPSQVEVIDNRVDSLLKKLSK